MRRTRNLFIRVVFHFLEASRVVLLAMRPSSWRRSNRSFLEAGIVPWHRSWEEFTTGEVVVRGD